MRSQSIRHAALAAALVLAAGCNKTQSHAISGRVVGLAGTGLVLSNGVGPSLAVAANGPVRFDGAWQEGTPFAVAVATQPTGPSQTCAVTSGHDRVTASDDLFTVVCTTDRHVVGGTVTGLAGAGLVLQDGGADDLAVDANGSFAFATPVASGASYAVTVKTQPSSPSQTCTVTGGSGTVVSGAVGTVQVSCATDAFALGGTVGGLAGAGLVLRSGATDLPVNANGTFAFPAPLASGASYAVTVTAQPAGPAQTCTVTGGAGTVDAAPVGSVRVECATRTFTVGGTVSGLAGTGLALRLDGSDELAVSEDGAFTFPRAVASGEGYEVSVSAQPSGPAQTCAVTGGRGTVVAGAVTGVAVSCSTLAFPVGGDVSGLEGSGLVLRQGGGDDLAVSARGGFAFATPVASGAAYDVTVAAQPHDPWQTCTVASGAGSVGAGPVATVRVDCATDAFPVGGTVTGLLGGEVVLANGADTVTVSSDGTFTFPPVRSGASYAVRVATQPALPSQTCVVTSAAGVVGGAPVTDVAVACTLDAFAVGGTATGVPPEGVTIANGADTLSLDFDGPFTFDALTSSGQAYAVEVVTVPPTYACSVDGATGTVTSGPATSIVLTCGCEEGRADCDGNPANGCEVVGSCGER